MKILLGFLLGVGSTLGGVLGWNYWAVAAEASRGTSSPITPPPSIPIPDVLDPTPDIPRVIYLNREGAILHAGVDDSSENASGILQDIGTLKVSYPAFGSSIRRWNDIVKCVTEHMEPYDVTVVDQRPTEEGYMMVMVGGRPGVLGSEEHAHVGGLAPFNGQVIREPIVFVFSQQLRNSLRDTCEATGQEIAHAYGLDHTYDCRDIMTYRRRCGRSRRFVDEDMRCGEHEERDCKPAAGPTQNSHAMLMERLGPRRVEEAPTP